MSELAEMFVIAMMFPLGICIINLGFCVYKMFFDDGGHDGTPQYDMISAGLMHTMVKNEV